VLEHGEGIDYRVAPDEDLHPRDVADRRPFVNDPITAELAVAVFEVVFDVELDIA
jgi:hypothetical protein